jgi:hypothetical protein
MFPPTAYSTNFLFIYNVRCSQGHKNFVSFVSFPLSIILFVFVRVIQRRRCLSRIYLATPPPPQVPYSDKDPLTSRNMDDELTSVMTEHFFYDTIFFITIDFTICMTESSLLA